MYFLDRGTDVRSTGSGTWAQCGVTQARLEAGLRAQAREDEVDEARSKSSGKKIIQAQISYIQGRKRLR